MSATDSSSHPLQSLNLFKLMLVQELIRTRWIIIPDWGHPPAHVCSQLTVFCSEHRMFAVTSDMWGPGDGTTVTTPEIF